MSENKLKPTFPFEGEAIIPFRVYPRAMDNLLFAFCILGHSDDRWAGDTAVSGYEDEHYWEEVSTGKTMTIVDKVTGCTHYLDTEKLMQGIRLWIEKRFGTFQEGKIVLKMDEVIADQIIQYALFEEVRYE